MPPLLILIGHAENGPIQESQASAIHPSLSIRTQTGSSSGCLWPCSDSLKFSITADRVHFPLIFGDQHIGELRQRFWTTCTCFRSQFQHFLAKQPCGFHLEIWVSVSFSIKLGIPTLPQITRENSNVKNTCHLVSPPHELDCLPHPSCPHAQHSSDTLLMMRYGAAMNTNK